MSSGNSDTLTTHYKMRFLLATALLVGGLTSAIAGNRSGTVTAQFLKLPTNARAVGMGSAQVAIARGPSSLGVNPAGIVTIEDYGFTATYNSWFADIQHSFFGGCVNLGDWGLVGASVTMLATDDMAVTTTAFPEGTGELFRASDYCFALSYARRISQEFSIGLSAKYIRSYLYNTSIGAATAAFDVGTLYELPLLQSRLGMSLTNLGNDMTFIDEAYSLPTSLRFGVAVTLMKTEQQSIEMAAQIARPNDADEQYNVGVEYWFGNMVALRGGYKFSYDAENVAAGMGLNLGAIGLRGSLDYGYNNFKWLPGTHSFSLDFEF